MALTERTTIGLLSISEDGTIRVRTDTVIERDGREVAREFHSRVLAPDEDVAGETDERLKAVLGVVWTDKVKADYAEKKKQRGEQVEAELSRRVP